MNKQPSRIMPGTKPGKWSVWLILTMFLLFFIGSSLTNTLYESVPSGDTILLDISRRPALALSMLAGMLAGVAAFITGLLAFLKKKERALLVYASSLIGALLLIFLVGEFIFPH